MNRKTTLYTIAIIFLIVIMITLYKGVNEQFDLTLGNNQFYGDFDKTCTKCTYNILDKNLNCTCNTNTKNITYRSSLLINREPIIENKDGRLNALPHNKFVSLKHYGGKCIHPLGGSSTPGNFKEAVLFDGCGENRLQFYFTDPVNKTGKIWHRTSGKCLRPAGRSGVGNNAVMQFAPSNECNDSRSNFTMLANGSIKHSSGKCFHPYGGSQTPGNNTRVVLFDGCNEKKNRFTIV
jgi:hypothetical protein